MRPTATFLVGEESGFRCETRNKRWCGRRGVSGTGVALVPEADDNPSVTFSFRMIRYPSNLPAFSMKIKSKTRED
ncbi:hypothetical protein BHM03_00042917 [Ensete ventricosum]|nr:hypothetical protein BHM03_00042917 [Ensete ventricosum]